MVENCAACKFFKNEESHPTEKHQDDWIGYCRRRSPAPFSSYIQDIGFLLADLHWKAFDGQETAFSGMVNFEASPQAMWPSITGDDWCGEFEARNG